MFFYMLQATRPEVRSAQGPFEPTRVPGQHEPSPDAANFDEHCCLADRVGLSLTTRKPCWMPLTESGHPFGPTRPSPDPLLPCVSTSPGETTGKAGGGGVGLKPVMESKPAPTWCMQWLILPHVVFGSTILFLLLFV